jgi:hypothetical protein
MSTKKERAIAGLRAAANRARENARENKKDLARKGTAALTAYAIGSAHLPGSDGRPRIEAIPTVWGLPRTATIALVSQGVSMVMPSGTAREVVAGVADASTAIALFQWGRGQPVSGGAVAGTRRRASSSVRQLEADLAAVSAADELRDPAYG